MTVEEQLLKLIVSSTDYKESAERLINDLKELVAKLARENETMRPYICEKNTCKDRKICLNYKSKR